MADNAHGEGGLGQHGTVLQVWKLVVDNVCVCLPYPHQRVAQAQVRYGAVAAHLPRDPTTLWMRNTGSDYRFDVWSSGCIMCVNLFVYVPQDEQ